MKSTAAKCVNTPRAVYPESRASRQAPVNEILQTYKEGISGKQPLRCDIIQRKIDYNTDAFWRFIRRLEDPRLINKLGVLIAILGDFGDFNIQGDYNVVYNIVETRDVTPAYTNIDGEDNRTIIVTIERWFLEIADIGEIVGIVSHELAVHCLGTINIDEAGVTQESDTGEAVSEVGGKSYRLPDTRRWKNGRGWFGAQRDHIEMAKPGSVRGYNYLSFVLAAINISIEKLLLSGRQLNEIIRCVAQQILYYALDMAMSLVIEDQRERVFKFYSNRNEIYRDPTINGQYYRKWPVCYDNQGGYAFCKTDQS